MTRLLWSRLALFVGLIALLLLTGLASHLTGEYL